MPRKPFDERQIEVNFRYLKTTIGMEVLHCKSLQGVLKEVYIFALAYNLIRLVMLEASRREKVPWTESVSSMPCIGFAVTTPTQS